MKTKVPTQESVIRVKNGWVMLPVILCIIIGAIVLFIYSIAAGVKSQDHPYFGHGRCGRLVLEVRIVYEAARCFAVYGAGSYG